MDFSKEFLDQWMQIMAEPGQSFEESAKEYLEDCLRAGIEARHNDKHP